mgnify:CR=1 FL=1
MEQHLKFVNCIGEFSYNTKTGELKLVKEFDDAEALQKSYELSTAKDIDNYENNLIGSINLINESIKNKDWKIAVASNSIRETVKLSLLSLGILEFVDYYISNEDVKRTKPYPEMYWKCMTELNVIPKNTIIVEDSHIGRQGAIDSGAHLLPIENANDLTFFKVMNKLNEIEIGRAHV